MCLLAGIRGLNGNLRCHPGGNSMSGTSVPTGGSISSDLKQPRLLPASLKDVSVGGYPGVEWEFEMPPGGKQYERYVCADGRFYFFRSEAAAFATSITEGCVCWRVSGG